MKQLTPLDSSSDQRAAASRANGRLGGRPKKPDALVHIAFRVTPEQKAWFRANGTAKLREIITKAMHEA